MGFGLSAGSFANGFLKGYSLASEIDNRDKILEEKLRQQRNEEEFARAQAQAFQNAHYETHPYTNTQEALGQDLYDPEFGMRAAYGAGGPYAGAANQPGFGLRDIVGERPAPDMQSYTREAMAAAGQYGQADRAAQLMQNYMSQANQQQNRADRQSELAWNRQFQERQENRLQGQSAQSQRIGDAQENRAQQRFDQEQQNARWVAQGQMLNFAASAPQSEAGAQQLTEVFEANRPGLESIWGNKAKAWTGFSYNPEAKRIEALFNEGKEDGSLTTIPFDPESLRMMGNSLIVKGGGQLKEQSTTHLQHSYDQYGRPVTGYMLPGGQFQQVGGAKDEGPSAYKLAHDRARYETDLRSAMVPEKQIPNLMAEYDKRMAVFSAPSHGGEVPPGYGVPGMSGGLPSTVPGGAAPTTPAAKADSSAAAAPTMSPAEKAVFDKAIGRGATPEQARAFVEDMKRKGRLR